MREFAMFLGFTLLTMRALASCAHVATPATAEASYTAQLLECIDRSATVEEARVCRADVNQRWHVDAGGGR